MWSRFFSQLCGLMVVAACSLPMMARAQFDDASDLVLSPQETQRLRDLVNTPVDPNTLTMRQADLYREKQMAAIQLGDKEALDKIMTAWLAVEPNGDAKWNAVNWHWNNGRRDEAYRVGNELIQERKWPPQKVRLMIQMANLKLQEHDLKDASAYIDKAENLVKYDFGQLSRRGADSFWIARAELEFYLMKSELESALGKWSQSIETSKIAVAKGKDVFRMLNMAQNEYYKAFGRKVVLMSQIQLAMRQTDAGLYADAEWTFRDTFKLIKQYGFSEAGLPMFYDRVADMHLASGQFQEALNFSQKSEKILLSQGVAARSPKWIQNQQRVHYALAAQNRWPELNAKFEAVDKAIAADADLAKIVGQQDLRGYALIQSKRPDEALAVLGPHLQTRIEQLGDAHFYTALTRGLYASALAQKGSPNDARQAFESALKHFTSPESMTGDFVETAFQRKTKRFILQGYMQLLAASATTQAKDAQTLFQIADQISGSTVQQALTEAAVRAGVNVPGLSDIIRKEQDARNEISSLSAYIANQNSESADKRNPQVVEQMRARKFELEKQRKEYKAQIQKSYPEYFQLIQPKSPSHTEIAQQLKPDELFVSILPMEDKTYVWAINAQGDVHFHNAALTEKDVHTLVTRIRKTLDVADLGARAPAFDYADAHRLYKEFMGPLEKKLEGKTHLIVATSGALAQMPLAVLTRTPTATTTQAQANWLIKDFAISHVPTANGWLSLKKLGQQPSSTQALMAWGDPTFDPKAQKIAAANTGSVVRSSVALRSLDASQRTVMDTDAYVTYSKLPALPETRDEVLELAKIMSADPAHDVILGAEATRQSVLKNSASGALGKKQVVVFATHGLLAGDLPSLNQPALAMAGTTSPNESPLLTLEDVLSLKLNADWVVLSACNTAGADGKAEEALSGLARGFFFAGSRSLLVTHWSVESESAMLLTTHTFAAYKKNPTMRRADALRQAMLETMKSPNYAHPAYWAPYALVGEGGR